jgi:prostaglandin-endoperoxide synthase 2
MNKQKALSAISILVGTIMLYRGIIDVTQYPGYWLRIILGFIELGGAVGMYLTYKRLKIGFWIFTALNVLVGIWMIFVLEDVWQHHVLPHIVFSAVFIPFYSALSWKRQRPGRSHDSPANGTAPEAS